jgi:hypothetical protein
MKKIAFLLAVLGCALLGEAVAAQYNHSITLNTGYYGSTKVSLNEGNVINIYAVSVDGNTFKVEIYSPFGDKVFSASSSGTMNRTYTVPASGKYEIRIYNGNMLSDVTVGYTITRTYAGRFGITRHQDIKVSGSEF